jgi:hypothetical protein
VSIKKRKKVSRTVGDPDSEMGWLSPTGEDESVNELGKKILDMLDDENIDEGEDEDKDYWVMDLCCGPATFTERLYEMTKDRDEEVNFVGVDLAPIHAQQRFAENEDVDAFGRDANSFLKVSQREYDFMYAINAFQEFKPGKFEPLAENISKSVRDDGYLCFTATENVLDIFRMLEDYSDQKFVEELSDGQEYLNVDSVMVDGIETSFNQYPRSLDDYLSTYSDLGFELEETGQVAVDTEPVVHITEAIEGCSTPPEPEIPGSQFDYAVMRRKV